MKKGFLLITAILLFSFGNIIAQNMQLTNASTTEVNGIYVNMGINGNSDGVDYYQKGSLYLYRYNNNSWIVGNDLGNNNLHTFYYYFDYSSGTYVTPDWLYLLTAGSLGSGSYPNVPLLLIQQHYQ